MDKENLNSIVDYIIHDKDMTIKEYSFYSKIAKLLNDLDCTYNLCSDYLHNLYEVKYNHDLDTFNDLL